MLIDPVTGARRQIIGGLIFAGVRTARRRRRATSRRSRRRRASARSTASTTRRCCAAAGASTTRRGTIPAAGTNGWGQIGYSAHDARAAGRRACRRVTIEQPVPERRSCSRRGNSLGLLTGAGGDICFVDPNKGAPRVQQYSADLQRELPGGMSLTLGYTGLTGSNLSCGGSTGRRADQHQPARSEVSERWPPTTRRQRAEPVLRRRRRRASSRRRRRSRAASCCGRSRSSATSTCSSRPARTRSTTPASSSCASASPALWGGNFSYTYSRLNDNQFGESNYYSSVAGPAEQLRGDSGIGVLQPGSGVRPQPARLAAQGRARADLACCPSARGTRS